VGLKTIEATRLGDWVEFETGAAPFALHAIPAVLASGEIASPPLPRERAPCKLSFVAEDLDAELQRLRDLGVSLLHRAWGGWDAVDPEGNVFGVRGRDG